MEQSSPFTDEFFQKLGNLLFPFLLPLVNLFLFPYISFCSCFLCLQSVVHEIGDHQSTFGLILEQLQSIQELNGQAGLVEKTCDRIRKRQEKLDKLLQELKGSSPILSSKQKSATLTPEPAEVRGQGIVITAQ